jgi:uncharacterized protein YndB with AHSA1/START domain
MVALGGDAVTIDIRAAVEPLIAWSFWVEPGRLTSWMGRTAEVDPRPGGVIRVDYGNGIVMRGTIVELEAPANLAFTWGWEDPTEAVRPGGSLVEVAFLPDGDGTLMQLRHSGLPDDAERASHLEGWDHFRPRLIEALDAEGRSTT